MARLAGGLALVRFGEVVAIELAIVVAKGRGETGAIVLFNYASQVFTSVYAVLAMSRSSARSPSCPRVMGRRSTGPAPASVFQRD